MRNDYVIIPAYNESATILKVANESKKYVNTVVVDDGSLDSTPKILSKLKGVTILTHKINLGKGAALKTGYDYAIKKGAKKIIMIDSDGQHKPSDIPKFLKALDKYDAVFSYRSSRSTMPKILRLGNWGLSRITYYLFKVNISDSQSGFRGFTSKAYRKVRWISADFDADNEMIARVGLRNLKYTEVPIETIYLDRYKGTTIVSGLKIGWRMLLMRLRWY